MASNKKILILNTGSGNNLGDRAMLFSVVSIIRECRPGWELMVSARVPIDAQREFNLAPKSFLVDCWGRFGFYAEKLPLPNMLISIIDSAYCVMITMLIVLLAFLSKIFGFRYGLRCMEADFIDSIVSCDCVYFSGGGYLTDEGRREARALMVTGIVAGLLGKTVVMSGQGLGPFRTFFSRVLMRYLGKVVRIVGLRDRGYGMGLIKSLGFSLDKVENVPDDAFGLPVKFSCAKHDKLIAVNLRASNILNSSSVARNKLISVLDRLNREGWGIRFFVFHERPEYEINLYNNWMAENRWHDVEIVKSADPRSLCLEVSKCNVAIGVAYHFSVFSIMANIPLLSLSFGEYYKNKINGLFEEVKSFREHIAGDELTEDYVYNFVSKSSEFVPEIALDAGGSGNELHRKFMHKLMQFMEN